MRRYGLIGTGHWANEVHAQALTRRPDGDFVGVWGRDPTKAQDVATRHGARAFDSPDELFQSVDVVSFAVPPDVQAPLAVRAGQAGCHLLLEKPTALDPGAAAEVVAATRDVATAVFFTLRYRPGVARWLDHLRQDGGWEGGRATWFGSIYHPGNSFGESPWRRRKGALWDVGPHALSLVLPVLGQVTRVSAVRGSGDTVHLVLGHDTGASSTVSLSLTVPEAAAIADVAFHGTAGWASLPADDTSSVDALSTALDQLLESADSGVAHPCDAMFGLQVVKVLAAAEEQLPHDANGGP